VPLQVVPSSTGQLTGCMPGATTWSPQDPTREREDLAKAKPLTTFNPDLRLAPNLLCTQAMARHEWRPLSPSLLTGGNLNTCTA